MTMDLSACERMSDEHPMPMFQLRKLLVEKIWTILNDDPNTHIPRVKCYDIADMAIREIHGNFDKMIIETIKSRLEKLL